MHRFIPADGGWESVVEAWERELIASLVEQVVFVLGIDAGVSADSQTAGYTGTRACESDRDAQILASLDFESEQANAAPPVRSAQADAELAPLLEVLLPDASEDPNVAVEIASITRERLRSLKYERIRHMLMELREPSGSDGRVRVVAGQEQGWLGALNDLRLVLALRLGIDTAEDAEEIHAVAWEEPPQEESEESRSRRAMAMVYDMLTWWQESLLTVLLSGDAPA